MIERRGEGPAGAARHDAAHLHGGGARRIKEHVHVRHLKRHGDEARIVGQAGKAQLGGEARSGRIQRLKGVAGTEITHDTEEHRAADGGVERIAASERSLRAIACVDDVPGAGIRANFIQGVAERGMPADDRGQIVLRRVAAAGGDVHGADHFRPQTDAEHGFGLRVAHAARREDLDAILRWSRDGERIRRSAKELPHRDAGCLRDTRGPRAGIVWCGHQSRAVADTIQARRFIHDEHVRIAIAVEITRGGELAFGFVARRGGEEAAGDEESCE